MRLGWRKKAEYKFGPPTPSAQRNPLQCWDCNQAVELGDRVVSKIGRGLGKSHIYHYKCAHKKNIV